MYQASSDRYQEMKYNRTGQSGLLLPAMSLGLWQNFGEDRPYAAAKETRRARKTLPGCSERLARW